MNQRKPKWEPSAPGHGGKLAPCPGVPCITYRVESIPWPLRPLTLPFDGLPFSLPIPFRTHNDNLIFVRRRRNAVYRVSVVDFIELAKRFPCSIDPFTYFSSWLACSAMGLAHRGSNLKRLTILMYQQRCLTRPQVSNRK